MEDAELAAILKCEQQDIKKAIKRLLDELRRKKREVSRLRSMLSSSLYGESDSPSRRSSSSKTR